MYFLCSVMMKIVVDALLVNNVWLLVRIGGVHVKHPVVDCIYHQMYSRVSGDHFRAITTA